MAQQIPGYYTIAELAELAELSEQAIRYHCRTGAMAGRVAYTQKIWLIPTAVGQDFLAEVVRSRKAV